jgi:hypothetical protein
MDNSKNFDGIIMLSVENQMLSFRKAEITGFHICAVLAQLGVICKPDKSGYDRFDIVICLFLAPSVQSVNPDFFEVGFRSLP